ENVMPLNGKLVIDFSTPDPPIVSDISICEGDSIPVLVAKGKNIKWYDDGGLTSLLHSGNEYIPEIIGGGIFNYYVTQTRNGRESLADTLTLTINPLPDAPVGEDVIYCEGDTIIDLHASGNNIRWYGDLELTNELSTGNYYNCGITTPGVYQYFPTQTISGCESDVATLALIINENPEPPESSDVSVCLGEEIPFLAADGVNISWYDDQNLTNLLHTGNTFDSEFNQVGQYKYYITQTFDECESKADTAILTIYPLPAINIGEDTTVTFDAEMILAVADDFESYIWNTGSILNYITVNGSNVGSGEHTYILQVMDLNQCTSSDSIKIMVQWPTGIFDASSSSLIKLYPNPGSAYVFISVNQLNNETINIRILDTTGKLIDENKFSIESEEELISMDISNIPFGTYIIQIETSDFLNVKKLIKN
ncbi:MAG: T9SS type A sorting domain-containing protein, partial [Cyclobacteriaceae bacterium]|nr:T9SS type A sorting domain-containing protein [Cyclobacteriaceae bacterium]